MPTKQFPANPSLDHLKHQAKDLLRQQALGKPSSAQRLREFHPSLRRATDLQIFAKHLTLTDAKLPSHANTGAQAGPDLSTISKGPA